MMRPCDTGTLGPAKVLAVGCLVGLLGCGRVLGISDLEYTDNSGTGGEGMTGSGGTAGGGSGNAGTGSGGIDGGGGSSDGGLAGAGGAAGSGLICDPSALALPVASAQKVKPSSAGAPAVGIRTPEPVFGTPLVRLTDQTDGQDCTLPYPQPVAPDGLSIAYGCGDKKALTLAVARLDSQSLASQQKLIVPPIPGGGAPRFEAQWSGKDALFLHDGKRVTRFDLVQKKHELIRDFSGGLGGAEIHSLSVSADGTRFAFTRGSDGPYTVWHRGSDTLEHYSEPDAQLVELDASGQWLFAQRFGSAPWLRIHNVGKGAADPGVLLNTGAPHYAPERRAAFVGFQLLGGVHNATPNGVAAILKRPSNAPTTFSTLVQLPGNGLAREMRDLPAWSAVSIYNSSPGPLSNELALFSLDGKLARRLAHHRASTPGFFVPALHPSANGCTVAYVSNWLKSLPLPGGGLGASHVFVLDLRL